MSVGSSTADDKLFPVHRAEVGLLLRSIPLHAVIDKGNCRLVGVSARKPTASYVKYFNLSECAELSVDMTWHRSCNVSKKYSLVLNIHTALTIV